MYRPRRRPGEIRVYVVDYGRKSLYLRYTDPVTGKPVAKSSKTSSRREAERAAAVWEAEINEGRWSRDPARTSWEQFREDYETQHLQSLASASQGNPIGVLSLFGKWMKPTTPQAITSSMLSRYADRLRRTPIKFRSGRTRQRSETTIKNHLVALHGALAWAKSQNLIKSVPDIPRVQRARKRKKGSKMKGRAPTETEFLAMVAAVKDVPLSKRISDSERTKRIAAIQRFLWLLRLSGLRIREALELWWDRPDCLHVTIEPDGRPYLCLHADLQKSHEDELLPITREFGEWLLATPEKERRGRVAPFPTSKGNANRFTAGRLLSKIGEIAGINVNPRSGKFASAHDVRRLFTTQELKRRVPALVQKICRHADISTTMAYYEDLKPTEIADEIWGDSAKRRDEKAE